MTHVCKLVLIDEDDKYLMIYRSKHPRFSNDPDLPGGTMEAGETALQTMVREVKEEIGVNVNPDEAKLVYQGTDYSMHKTQYSLFVVQVKKRPEIVISWEHSNYKWINRNQFLNTAKGALDTYMHMAYDQISNL